MNISIGINLPGYGHNGGRSDATWTRLDVEIARHAPPGHAAE